MHQSLALTVAYGRGRARDVPSPSLGRPRGHLNVIAAFLAIALRRLLETIGFRGE